MLAQPPNDARVSGAGPVRKTSLRANACKAPHPLQPIVRRRVVSTGTEPARRSGSHWRGAPDLVIQQIAETFNQMLTTSCGSLTLAK